MEFSMRVVCPENEELVAYLLSKRQEMARSGKGISDNTDSTLYKAYTNICNCEIPIKTLKDLSQIKGVGKWILKQMQGHFETDSNCPEDGLARKGNKNKGPKRYVPQKNSVSYALLISLYRGTRNGTAYMYKKDLIEDAETSGLSRMPIMPEKAKGRSGHFVSSPRDWYSGWSCMKTLISRGLVAKSSCPAKYMLTDEGKDIACECLLRSGVVEPNESLNTQEVSVNLNKRSEYIVDLQEDLPSSESVIGSSLKQVPQPSFDLRKQKILDVPPDCLNKFIGMGFSHQQIVHAYSEVMETSHRNEISSLWTTVLCRLREDEIYGRGGSHARENVELREPAYEKHCSYTLKACSSNLWS